jgi:cobalt-precorrin-7 (C5)-methyltransferase
VRDVNDGKIVFLLTDPKFNVQDLYARLGALPMPLKIALCENLGYPHERIFIGDIQSPPQPAEALYSLVIGIF